MYDIQYDDGEIEEKVLDEFMRLYTPPIRIGPKVIPQGFKIADNVEVRYKGREKWYPAKISQICGNDCYDVQYDDGDREYYIHSNIILYLTRRLF